MQYIAVPAGPWQQPVAPEMMFFDTVKDGVDLNSPTNDNLLSIELRKARTALGNGGNTMIVAGQSDIYYFTELARARYNAGSSLEPLSALCRPSANQTWSQHATALGTVGMYSQSNYQIVTIVPPTLDGSRPATFPIVGVRSAISASRTYTVFIGVNYRTAANSVGTTNVTGYYTPSSSPSGGTISQGENNVWTITNTYSHFSWPSGLSVSDTGYGPSVVVPTTTPDARGIRVKQSLIDAEQLDLSDACLNYAGLMIKLKKGRDYLIADNCVPGNNYPVDLSPTRMSLML